MANHKRKGPKSTRSGCLLCKPWKLKGEPKHSVLKHLVNEGGRKNE